VADRPHPVLGEAAEIASASPDPTTIARLGQLVPAFMFIGFAAVLSAISLAIARILGAFRRGGGEVQETAGRNVQTLRTSPTARAFMVSMMMGTLAILIPVVLHSVVAANIDPWAADSVERWSTVLEGFRRLGVALYLFGIALGLGTIIHVLRFQAVRVRQLAAETRRPA
jgi:hypothetical protein